MVDDHEGHGVHAKAGHAELDPEAHYFQDLRLHQRIRGVEVGLEIVEAVEEPGAGFLVVAPGRFLHAGKHHALVGAGRLFVGPDIPVAMRGILCSARRLEPGVLVRGVVDDEVDDHADAALLAAMGELDEIAERAVARIDAVIVGDVVAVVLARRGLKRHQPDRGDAESMQVVDAAQQPLEVADTITVRVHIGANGKAINHTILVPEIVDHNTVGSPSIDDKQLGSPEFPRLEAELRDGLMCL